MNALVTGWSGFIGSHLTKRLLNEHFNVEAFQGDISKKDVMKWLGDCDVVFHLAAANPNRGFSGRRMVEVNVFGTWNLLDWVRRYAEDAVFVFSSTGSVYGEPVYSPQDEKHPCKPTSVYGETKLTAEKLVSIYNQKYGLKTVVLRYYNVLSENGSSFAAVFARNIKAGLPVTLNGRGLQVRCPTHVDDVIDANLLAYKTANAYGKVFNIAGLEYVTVRDVALKVGEILGLPVKFKCARRHPYDVTRFEPDISLANDVLGFKPKRSLGFMLREIAKNA